VTEKTRLAPVPNGFSPLYVHRLAYSDGFAAGSVTYRAGYALLPASGSCRTGGPFFKVTTSPLYARRRTNLHRSEMRMHK